MPVARNTARIAASRRCANVLPRHALLQFRKFYAGEERHRLLPHLGRAQPGHGVGNLVFGGQPAEELPQRPVLLARVRLAVAAQQPRDPPLDVLRVYLLPPGLIRLAEQVSGGEPARRLGVDPDRPGRLVLRRQVQPERGDIRRERPRVQPPRTTPAPLGTAEVSRSSPLPHPQAVRITASGHSRTAAENLAYTSSKISASCVSAGRRANDLKLRPGGQGQGRTADLPLFSRAVLYRGMPFVRGDSVGNYAADPDLWGFCGATTRSSTRFPGHQEHPGNANGAARRAGPDRGASFSAAAISRGAIMLSRTTGTCASCYRRHARHLDEQQPGHRTAAPAHPGEALTTDPADAGQHPEHPLPPTRASLQQRVTTPGMPRTDSTRRTPI